MEPILKTLVDKLADGTARIRDTSRSSIEAIAACPQIGPSVVAAHGMTATSKSTWRAILGRLQLLTDLVIAYGVGSKSGVSVDAAMNFIKSVGAFSHSNGEVRDGAKDLVVALQKHVGTEGVIDYLTDLRPKQMEEYKMAFADGGGGMGGAGGKGSKASLPPAEAKEAGRKGSAGGADRQQSKRNSEAKPTNKVPASGQRSDAKSPQKSSHQHAGEPAGADDFTKCMFCGKTEPTWSEDLLDLHYWKECPLLSPCPACAQIVEIAGLPEHLLEECEHRQNFVPCDTTGLAIRKEDFAAWQESTACTPPPENSMYCPLCLTAIVDSDDMWRQHLLYACKRNNRSYSK
jgi:centrosomal protein CEP104